VADLRGVATLAGGVIDVTPAYVVVVEAGDGVGRGVGSRSTSLAPRNIVSNFVIGAPIDASSWLRGSASRKLIRRSGSSQRISVTKGR
jgi:hypothetical protein